MIETTQSSDRKGSRTHLTRNQERTGFLCQFENGVTAYTVPVALWIEGPLNVEALERACQEVFRRYPVLRLRLENAPDGIDAAFDSEPPTRLAQTDLTNLPESEREQEAMRVAGACARQPFDLFKGPLVRASLLEMAPTQHLLVTVFHELVADAPSSAIFVRDLAAQYEALAAGHALPSPEGVKFFDSYVQRERAASEGQEVEEALAFWRNELAADPPILDLSVDRPVPPVYSYSGASLRWTFSEAVAAGFERLAQTEGVSMESALLSAWVALLGRYTRQEDLTTGTPADLRTDAQWCNVFGPIENTVVIRLPLDDNPSFRHLVHLAADQIDNARKHAVAPFAQVVDALQPQRDMSHSPFFQVFLEFRAAFEERTCAGARFIPVHVDEETSKYALTLSIEQSPSGLSGAIAYNTDLFDRTTIMRAVMHLQILFEGAVRNPDARVSELPLLQDTERGQLLYDWIPPVRELPAPCCIHEMFEAQARRTPEATAVEFGDRHLTYSDLGALADSVARRLRELDVRPGTVVGLFMDRRPEAVAGLLGILKAGGVYLPLDPAYPKERIAFMLEDARAPVVLTLEALRERLPDNAAQMLCLDALSPTPDDQPSAAISPDQWAYIIYTSGSTGQPKGVCVAHREAAWHFATMRQTYAIQPQDRVLQFASLSFDVSLEQIFVPLISGATLVMGDENPWEPRGFASYLCAARISVLNVPPAFWQQWTEEELAAGQADFGPEFRLLIVGGDIAPLETVRKWQRTPATAGIRLLNAYGPTETIITSTLFEIPADFAATAASTRVPIGRPLPGTEVYILDKHMNPVPIGVVGELYIGGNRLARGYLNRPDLTAERFVPHPFTDRSGARLYRTGDLARYLADGNIEFVGRADDQVKLRGFRIELGEIEATLLQHPHVREAVVARREDPPGPPYLAAYVVAKETGEIDAAALREHVRTKLPEFMVPSAFVFVDALPLTPSGKVDRRALPAPARDHRATEDDRVAQPRTPVEGLLAQVWAGVLGLDRVGIHDDFFDLGGHSLLATRVLSRIRDLFGVSLPLRALFESRTLAALAARVEETRGARDEAPAPPLEPVSRDKDLPLSFSQQGLWFLDRFQPGLPAYNIPVVLRLSGPLDMDALTRSLEEIVRRHEALRTTFPERDGQPVQMICEPGAFGPNVIDLTERSETQREEQARRIETEGAQRPFDLLRGPLFRIDLIKLSETEHVLSAQFHHIIFDGWSVSVFLQELAALYEAFVQDRPCPLPDLRIQFADFACWQRKWIQTEAATRSLEYWRGQLTGPLPVLELPADHPRPPVQTYRGAVEARALSPVLSERVRRFSRQAGVTDFVTLLAAWKTLLHRYTGQEDIIVGTAMAGRNHAETEDLLGFFVNTVVLRSDLSGDPRFAQFLIREQAMALAAYEHQEFPFENIVAELHPDRDVSRSPMFQVMFVVQNTPVRVTRFGSLTFREEDIDNGTAKFDLLLNVDERDGRLALSLEYNTDLFEPSTARRILDHYETLLLGVVEDPDRRLSDLPLLTAEEQQMIEAWNATDAPYPETVRLHDLFREQVERTPDAVAVEFEGVTLTYRDLDRRANQLAHHLRGLGAGPGSLVGVCLQRSIELIVTLCGVLKAGAAYVPLDPSYPKERLGHMLADASAPVLVTQQALRDRLPNHAGKVICLGECQATLDREPDADPQAPGTADDPSYVIFTSGSTGRPKGVVNTHRGICNHLLWMREQYPLTTEDRVLQKTPFSFDVSVWEIFWPLTCGARLVVARPEGHKDTAYLIKTIQDRGITNIHFVPSMLRVFLEEARAGDCASVRRVICSGEAIGYDLQQRFFECMNADLLNLFGPTEAAVHVTAWECERTGQRGVVPIGRPIANTRMYVLDAHRHWAPIGVAGELYIGGVQVARGYLNRPELTAEAFVPDPFRNEPGARLYKTGDLGRFLPDGAIEFLGRADFQVKIRGNRIELGEIESVLLQHPSVRGAVAVVRQDTLDDVRLTAYVVPADRDQFDAAALRQFLRAQLPEYMIPNDFVALDALPLSPNGKVDRRALPAPDRGGSASAPHERVAPRTELEVLLARIWCDVLRLDQIGVYDNFFDLGGHSLLATRVMARVREALRIEVPLRRLFEGPTVAGLSAVAEEALLDEIEQMSDAEAARLVDEVSERKQ